MPQELESLKNNQNFSTWGGARGGAGRKPGISPATTVKRQLVDFVDDKELRRLIKIAIRMAHKGNKDMLKYVLDQCLGKAAPKINLEQVAIPEQKPLTPEELEDEEKVWRYRGELYDARLRAKFAAGRQEEIKDGV